MSLEEKIPLYLIGGLLLLFCLVGIHVYRWSKKHRKMMIKFATANGLTYQKEASSQLVRDLESMFAGRVFPKSVGHPKDLLFDGKVKLFRCTETTIMSKNASNTAIIAAMVDAPKNSDLYCSFSGTKEFKFTKQLHESKSNRFGNSKYFGNTQNNPYYLQIQNTVKTLPPDHRLWVLSKAGKTVLYIMPNIVGRETPRDLAQLYRYAKAFSKLA